MTDEVAENTVFHIYELKGAAVRRKAEKKRHQDNRRRKTDRARMLMGGILYPVDA
jgi:hypothetical protein